MSYVMEGLCGCICLKCSSYILHIPTVREQSRIVQYYWSSANLQDTPGTSHNHSRFFPLTFFLVVSKESCVPGVIIMYCSLVMISFNNAVLTIFLLMHANKPLQCAIIQLARFSQWKCVADLKFVHVLQLTTNNERFARWFLSIWRISWEKWSL